MGWSGLNKDLRYAKYATILAASHPVFAGIKDPYLHLWNEFDGRVADDAFERPSSVGKYEQGNWTPLAASAKNTQISLAEIFYGKGKLLACQLHIIDDLKNAQAKCLFDNMLNYLSNSNAEQLNTTVAIEGNLNADDISKLTGVSTQFLSGDNGTECLLAFEGTDLKTLKDWAAKGGTVLVFSDKVSANFDGITTTFKQGEQYVASKVNDHPLLY
jgi:hypothetical protein